MWEGAGLPRVITQDSDRNVLGLCGFGGGSIEKGDLQAAGSGLGPSPVLSLSWSSGQGELPEPHFPISTMGITILPNRLVAECLAQCLAHRKCAGKGSNELELASQSFCATGGRESGALGLPFPAGELPAKSPTWRRCRQGSVLECVAFWEPSR